MEQAKVTNCALAMDNEFKGEHQMNRSEEKIIELPYIHDARGGLSYIESFVHIPFEIKRVYYLYNVPVNAERGGHAHANLEQVLIALSGSFRVKINNGEKNSEYWLRNPQQGLYLGNLIWREIDNFSQGSVCMVLASQYYDEDDYYRNYDEFIAAIGRN
jgi:uncharacterized RmlC-like cupin family protein